jgi:imidazolonepropionase-like amidohydrolase
MLEAGITATRCLGSSISPYLRRAINEGHVPGPRIVAAGEFICSTSGTWDHISFPLEWIKAQGMLADGIDGVREMVRRRIRQGANVIKVGLSKGGVDDKYHPWGDDPFNQVASYSPEEVRALTQEAHLNKLKVSAHCIGDESVRLALDGGVDVIEHGYGITEDTRKMLIDQNALLVSTISQLYFHNQAAEPYHYPDWLQQVFKRHLDAMQADFEKSLQVGVRYALGTDLVGYPTHPQDMAAKEFELAVNWGMDPLQAVVAGTKVSAEALGMEHLIGTIETGKLADLIGLDGDPLRDITVLQQGVKFVMQDGDIIVDRTKTVAA